MILNNYWKLNKRKKVTILKDFLLFFTGIMKLSFFGERKLCSKEEETHVQAFENLIEKIEEMYSDSCFCLAISKPRMMN